MGSGKAAMSPSPAKYAGTSSRANLCRSLYATRMVASAAPLTFEMSLGEGCRLA